jgi:sterol desaturase/sphingolipid hydroxylase (fatty acid hydroxylase superfamily)
MDLFSIEHSKAAYCLDFALYALAVVVLASFLVWAGPRDERIQIASLAVIGLASWSAVEYAFHRFVLHGLQPFRRWHAEHHERPRALISAPTILSATLIVTLVFLPMLALGNLWLACALTWGVLTGYLAYAITHHATHHWRADNAWLKERKRWHALHHHRIDPPGCYGVTSSFWDHVFGSARPARVDC